MIPASGKVSMADLRTEYMPAGSNAMVELSAFYRGGASGFVRNNAGNNTAVNGSASIVTSGPIKLSDFRGKTAGWIFTNSGTLTDVLMATPFGNDWTVNWPKIYINNGVIGGVRGVSWAFRIEGGAGRLEFINNSEVQGSYGAINSGGGYHAVHINSTSRVYITNNGALRGGGGAGGAGGAGGTGGQGYYNYTAQEGPYYDSGTQVENQQSWTYTGGQGGGTHNEPGYCAFQWGGGTVASPSPNTSAVAVGGYTYYRGAFRAGANGGGSIAYYEIYRQWGATAYTNGGGGGGGANGGYGQGYGLANTAGGAGAGGAPGGTNAGAGGAGGNGGNGGTWGQNGANGAAGAGGGYGNYSGWGSAGAGGGGGGPAGYAVHAETAWTKTVAGTMQGPQAPVAAS